MNDHGADAVRWFMLASGSPWQARRVGHAAIGDVVRKTLLTYWNTVSFQSMYARLADWEPSHPAPAITDRPVIDRWLSAQACELAHEVDIALEAFDTQRAGRLLSTFIDDLSNWYVRRSRRRFWDGDPAALSTLHEALRITTLCMAPFTPFIAERVWQDLFRATDPAAPTSVHLAAWPESAEALEHPALAENINDSALAENMALVRRVVELGRAARATSGVRTRQPLGRALVSASGWSRLSDELRAEVCEELNVGVIETLADDTAGFVDTAIKANFRALGQRFGKQTPLVAEAIAGADPVGLLSHIRLAGSVSLHVAGVGDVEISESDLVVTETPRDGWAVAAEGGESLALDLHITDELQRAGTAREIVRAIQEARKQSGFDVSDRITVWWASDDLSILHTLEEHTELIASEVLATAFDEGIEHARAGAVTVSVPETDLRLLIARASDR